MKILYNKIVQEKLKQDVNKNKPSTTTQIHVQVEKNSQSSVIISYKQDTTENGKNYKNEFVFAINQNVKL